MPHDFAVYAVLLFNTALAVVTVSVCWRLCWRLTWKSRKDEARHCREEAIALVLELTDCQRQEEPTSEEVESCRRICRLADAKLLVAGFPEDWANCVDMLERHLRVMREIRAKYAA